MHKMVFSVAQVNRYIRQIMEEDALLAGFWVEGEISNCKPHTSGHLYFTLKDSQAAVSGVMFKSYAQALPFTPKNGMKAVVFGHVSLYEKTGQYQLYAERMEPSGTGGLQAAFEQLRDRLRDEGLFDPARKRPIPPYPRCVAVVTSPTGAAVRDIIRVIRERNPVVRIVIVPALVQGENAAADIARAMEEVNAWGVADVIILGRGGGSAEDLWAFNEEAVARAVVASAIPVISAVGHETDFTIADFAADLRAPTPTAAAVMAVYDRMEALSEVATLTEALVKAARARYDDARGRLFAVSKSRVFRKPLEPIYERQLYVQQLTGRLTRRMDALLAKKRTELDNRIALLEKVSPYHIWERGYAAIRDSENAVIRSVKELQPGMEIELRLADGSALAIVKERTYIQPGRADAGC